MASEHPHLLHREHGLRRNTQTHKTQEPSVVKPQGIVGLQRLVGNQAVQRLLSEGKMSPQGSLQRCNCGKDDEI